MTGVTSTTCYADYCFRKCVFLISWQFVRATDGRRPPQSSWQVRDVMRLNEQRYERDLCVSRSRGFMRGALEALHHIERSGEEVSWGCAAAGHTCVSILVYCVFN